MGQGTSSDGPPPVMQRELCLLEGRGLGMCIVVRCVCTCCPLMVESCLVAADKKSDAEDSPAEKGEEEEEEEEEAQDENDASAEVGVTRFIEGPARSSLWRG